MTLEIALVLGILVAAVILFVTEVVRVDLVALMVLVPHIASASSDTRGKMASMAASNALAHLRRERAPDIVNPEVYDTDAYRRRTGG